MQNRMRRLALVAAVLLVCGCTSSRPRMLRVSSDYPGASPRDVADALARRIEVNLRGVPGVASITSISSPGRLETYVLVERDGDPKELLLRVATRLGNIEHQLPSEATPPNVEILPTTATVPVIQPTQIDCVVVRLDPWAIAKHGISTRNIVEAIQQQAGGSAVDISRVAKLRAIRVPGPQGHLVPLAGLAEIRIEKQPSHIVTRWPSEQ